MAMDGPAESARTKNITCHPARYNSPITIMRTQSDTRQILSSPTVATTDRIHPTIRGRSISSTPLGCSLTGIGKNFLACLRTLCVSCLPVGAASRRARARCDNWARDGGEPIYGSHPRHKTPRARSKASGASSWLRVFRAIV